MRGRLASLLVVTALASTPTACAAPPAERHPAVASVVALLKLRSARSRNATDYDPYVAYSSVATAFATAAGSEPATRPPTPSWRAPYVSSVSSDSADVIVVWTPSAAFPEWPAATRFITRYVDGRWVITDALSVETTAIPGPLMTPTKGVQ